MADTPRPDQSIPRLDLDSSYIEPPAQWLAPYVSPAPGQGPPGHSSWLAADTHLWDYVRVVYRRRWPAITAFVIVFATTAANTFTSTPIYEARAQILIENQTENVVSFDEVVEQNRTPDYYQTQYRLLQSRSLAKRAMDGAELWSDPVFKGGGGGGGGFSLRGTANAVIAAVRGAFQQEPSTDAPPDETQAQSRAVTQFLGGLTVSPVRASRLVDVVYASPDPVLSAKAANALARAYRDQMLEYRTFAAREATEFLSRQLGTQRKAVEDSELAMQRYREKDAAVSLEDRQNIVVQRLSDLNTAVTRARTDRIQKEANYNQIRAVQDDPAKLDTVPAVLANPFIQQLKTELGELTRSQVEMSDKLAERHPSMVKVRSAIQMAEAKLKAEVANIVQAVRSDYQSAVEQERSLISALDQQEAAALELSRLSIDYGALQRDATSNRQLYDGLLQRTKETGITGELTTNNIRIVDLAETPRRPARPNKAVNLTLGCFGGLVLGIGLAFFFEYLDDRIKTPDEIRTHLRLPFLGLVPLVDTASSDGLRMDTVAPGMFGESFRSIRTNVLFSSIDHQSKAMVVTSSAPGEGKTLVSSNLAVALANVGQRVVIIDADMRRPRIHKMFGLAQEPGLSNMLVGTAKASEAVQRSSVPGLMVLPAGKNPPNPAELVGSRRFREFLRSLDEHFDWVIVDSPPVMAVADSMIVAHETKGVLFVVGSEMTQRAVAQRAIDQLAQAKVNVIGAVLNRVDIKHNAYYYSNYYRREYDAYQAPAAASTDR